jgi:hypothetical protein
MDGLPLSQRHHCLQGVCVRHLRLPILPFLYHSLRDQSSQLDSVADRLAHICSCVIGGANGQPRRVFILVAYLEAMGLIMVSSAWATSDSGRSLRLAAATNLTDIESAVD